MCVVQGAQLRFVHAISWGSSRLTQTLADRQGCSLLEAQAILQRDDVAIAPHGNLAWGKAGARMETGALVPEFERLGREMHRLLNYYRSLFPERSYEGILDRLVLSGGPANLKGLDRFFAEIFQLDVTVRNPFQSLESRLSSGSFAAIEEHKNSFAMAIGVALGSLQRGVGHAKATCTSTREFVWRRAASQ
jgi:Tfp pilus assembly PilM family ATPase